jgi:Family of unknown function (DUF6885)
MRWSTEQHLVKAESAELQQKDYLCGPFHGARALRDAGMTAWDGEPVDQDLVALHAGTLLPEDDGGPEVPPGAQPRRDYRYELPRTDPARSGTSAPGLAAAIEELSGGELVCVPLSGAWTTVAAERLLTALAASDVRLIANLRTGPLWGSRPPLDALLAALDGVEPDEPPAPDWDVGHYIELVQLLRGRAGALAVVRDSYPSLGWGGFHVQPPSALAAALRRGDGRQGGVLAVASRDGAAAVKRLAPELGLEAKIWDN